MGDPAGGVGTEPGLGPAGVSAPRDHGGILAANFDSTPRRRLSPDLELVTQPGVALAAAAAEIGTDGAGASRRPCGSPSNLSDVPLSSTEYRLFPTPAASDVEEGMTDSSSKQTI